MLTCKRAVSTWLLALVSVLLAGRIWPQSIGNHNARYDSNGTLLAWTSWEEIMQREVNWYLQCPVEKGYPRFVAMTFMDGDYKPIPKRDSFIPATQNGMGIISYLKYHAYLHKKDPRLLAMARSMGDYLVKEANTPNEGKYPRFTRSTGWRSRFPQPPDCGCQEDRPYQIEPDKGGIAGYALLLLWEETGEQAYFDQAVHNAQVLAQNMRPGNDIQSPWPFRVDYRTGEADGEVSGNMVYILRLFDKLIRNDHKEFQSQRDELWRWIKTCQLPNLKTDGLLWVQFFEDHREEDNRTAWAPLNMARYLLEARERLDPEWQVDARNLIEFVNKHFTGIRHGILNCGEQTHDLNCWGGINSTYGAVLAMYCSATGSEEYKGLAFAAMNYSLYAVDRDGCPGDGTWRGRHRGGWQEDCHTDKLHNVLDAIMAFPEWAN